MALIDATLQLLSEKGESGFTVDDVLTTSRISKGSMYHHFVDFDDLLDQSYTEQYSRYVEEDISAISQLLPGCSTADEFLDRISVLARGIHSVERAHRRAQRVAALARSEYRPAMRVALAEAQSHVTDAFTDLFREFQERGILRTDFSPRMYGTFVQAYSIGKIIDDVTVQPVDSDEWTHFVMTMVRSWVADGATARQADRTS